MTSDAGPQGQKGADPIRYWPFVSILLEGEPRRGSCQDVVALLIYEVGFGMTWEVEGRKGTVKNPGWDLDEARRELGGDEASIEVDGCRYQFSLAAWRRVPPEAWRVIPMGFRRGEIPERDEYFKRWETLQEMRARSHEDQTVVTDPRGGRHTLSLRPWSGLPPSRTRLSVRFAADYGNQNWWRRHYGRLIYGEVERERARGLDPTPRHFNPAKRTREEHSKESDP